MEKFELKPNQRIALIRPKVTSIFTPPNPYLTVVHLNPVDYPNLDRMEDDY